MRRAAPWILSVLLVSPAQAGEGMWQPHQLPALGSELKSMGLELDPDSMTRLTEHPMNAVISLGGCTASFVSPEGLIITNHHCVYGSLQYNSSASRNLIVDGFLATDRSAELPASPGTRAWVTVQVSDVTGRVRDSLADDLGPVERYQKIEDREKRIIAECEKDPGHRCRVAGFHGGLQYYLVKRMEIRDVRLVHAPADSIGQFGGDIDNWMWPRHTGDYGFYRAYVGPDGKPADHAEGNLPYRPKHWLRLAPEGLQEDEFLMVIGYPGRTNRYRLAREVESRFNWFYPTARKMLGERIEVIERATAGRPDAAIKYAGSLAGLNNAHKNYQGMIDGYSGSGMLERKRQREAELAEWIRGDARRISEYGPVLEELDALIARDDATRERDLVLGALDRLSLVRTARQLYRLSHERKKPDEQREPGYQLRDMKRLGQRLDRLDRRYDRSVERALFEYIVGRYEELAVSDRRPDLDRFLRLTRQADVRQQRMDWLFGGSSLEHPQQRRAWIEAGSDAFESSDDPFIQMAVAMYAGDRKLEQEDKAISGEFLQLRPRYMQAMIEFETGRGTAVYADANSTLRVTYGTVRGSSPRDGLYYKPFTRLEGILEKYTGEEPFDSPARQLEAVREREHGRYALAALDSVPVNFLSNVDTTGGNSGSPTVNGRGELVGLLFDGTYDSINSDWGYIRETTRSIHVDVRYILWVMEQVYSTRGLLSELGVGADESARAGDVP